MALICTTGVQYNKSSPTYGSSQIHVHKIKTTQKARRRGHCALACAIHRAESTAMLHVTANEVKNAIFMLSSSIVTNASTATTVTVTCNTIVNTARITDPRKANTY